MKNKELQNYLKGIRIDFLVCNYCTYSDTTLLTSLQSYEIICYIATFK